MLEEEEDAAPATPSLFASLLSTTQAPYPVFFFVVVVVSVVIVQIDRYCLFFVSVIGDLVIDDYLCSSKILFWTGSSLIPSIASTQKTKNYYQLSYKIINVTTTKQKKST